MDEPFELPVNFRDKELLFPAQLKQSGYTHSIIVDVYGQEVSFEPDEERNYRAIIGQEELSKQTTIELLRAIAKAIEDIVK